MMQEKHGRWHIQLENISRDIAEKISNRPDVTEVGWSSVFNSDADQPYTIDGRKAALYGTDNIYLSQLADGMEEGVFPQNDQEVVLSSNAQLALNVQIGGFCDGFRHRQEMWILRYPALVPTTRSIMKGRRI